MAPKINNNPPITELRGISPSDLAAEELKMAVLTKSMSYKKQTDNSKISGKKVNKVKNLTKRYKAQKRTKQNFWS